MISVDNLLNDEEFKFINTLIDNIDYDSKYYVRATKVRNYFNQIRQQKLTFVIKM